MGLVEDGLNAENQGSQEAEKRNIGVCTVVSKNYLASARALQESLSRHHPDVPLYVLLVDRVDGVFDPAAEAFEMILAEDLKNIPEQDRFFFKYDILELNTAVKPFFFEYLFTRYGLRKLIYFDPDILVFSPLDQIWQLLDSHSAVLTPHITQPLEDRCSPNEVDFLRVGVFNLGFIAMASTEPTCAFLHWWQKRLYDFCLAEPENGYFTDQKWVDLAPLLFAGFYILSDPEFNIAYWNLHARSGVQMTEDEVLLDGRPVRFFHFSGFRPDQPDIISKHQDRFTFDDLPHLRPLFDYYARCLLSQGYADTKQWPYAYGSFDNGIAIPGRVRRMYREMGEKAHSFGDPFSTRQPNSFFNWLKQPAALKRLWLDIHQSRPDVQRALPDPLGRDKASFYGWLRERGREEYGLEDVFLPPAQLSEQQRPRRPRLRKALKPLFIKWMQENHPGMLSQLVAYKHRLGRITNRPAPVREGPQEKPDSAVDPALPAGVNVAGYLAGEFGVAEASRGLVHALRAAGIPHTLNNIVVEDRRHLDDTFTEFTDANPFAVNLATVNADMVEHLRHVKGPDYFRGRYNIGVWYWELSRFPEQWWPSFAPFQEIWVTSAFCAEAIAKVSPIPVVKITQPILIDEAAIRPNRARFGIEEGRFAFLFTFDYQSFIERKNPLGVIEAFRRTFGTGSDALLVLKSINAPMFPEKAALVRDAAEGLNVRFRDEYLLRSETLDLLASCDCLVSLHRSEGLGLGMAEAMYLGKPVIATAYSGNTEFMDVNNSFPVRYRLVELTEDYGPYTKGNVWADPDLDHAAGQMRLVYDNRDAAARIGRRAAEDMKTHRCPTVAGREIRERLSRILGREL